LSCSGGGMAGETEDRGLGVREKGASLPLPVQFPMRGNWGGGGYRCVDKRHEFSGRKRENRLHHDESSPRKFLVFFGFLLPPPPPPTPTPQTPTHLTPHPPTPPPQPHNPTPPPPHPRGRNAKLGKREHLSLLRFAPRWKHTLQLN